NGTWDDNYVVVHHLSDLIDSTQYGNNGTNNGATSTTSGRAGDAYNFDNSTDYIEIADDPTLDLTGNHTLSAWIFGADNDTDYQSVIVRTNTANDDWDYALNASAAPDTEHPSYYNDYDILASSVDVNHNDWTYLVVTWNGTNRIIYVDGQNRGSDTNNPLIQNNGNPLFIGDSGEVLWDEGYVGIIDEVRVSDYPRTTNWIQTSFNNQGTPSSFYGLDSQETPSVTPAGKEMSTTLGSGAATNLFDSADDEAYWYTELTYPSGGDDAGIAAGDYALNMYFSQLPTIPADWYSVDWTYRKEITIDNTQVIGASDHSSFPVLVNLSSDTDLAADAQPDFDDILFTSDNGTTKLSHEIEKYNETTGELVAWVKVPTLSTSVDTVLYMYYGNNTVGSQQDVANVWTDYEAVYHLNDDFLDSTSNNHTGTNFGSVDIGGRVADGQDFEGSDTTDRVEIGTFSAGTGQALTLQTWANWESFPLSDGRMLSKATGTGGEDHVFLLGENEITAGNHGLRMRLKTGTDDLIGTTTLLSSATTIPTGTWVLLAGTYDGSDMRVIQDGIEVGSTPKTGDMRVNDWDFFIGNQPLLPVGERWMDGVLDEVRIARIDRSADWLRTEYNNQGSVATFFKPLGSEELLPSVDITVSVYHTKGDGTDPQEIITSSTVTIDGNTSDPYALDIGSGLAQTFTSADPRHVRVHIDVTAVNTGGSFTLAYDSVTDHSSLDTPSMVIPDVTLLLVAAVIIIPILTGLLTKKRRITVRIISVAVSVIIALTLLADQVG
ncbi:MAG: DUF2341 domain-containing protein, partial [candidate division Zixibacteria bacterium]|nr:DUF2341 domain-containing protein [candidate division Zixibacteria bacterium]